MWTSMLRNKICDLWMGIEAKWGGSKDKSPREIPANWMLFQFRFKIYFSCLCIFKNYIYTKTCIYITSSFFCPLFKFTNVHIHIQMRVLEYIFVTVYLLEVKETLLLVLLGVFILVFFYFWAVPYVLFTFSSFLFQDRCTIILQRTHPCMLRICN